MGLFDSYNPNPNPAPNPTPVPVSEGFNHSSQGLFAPAVLVQPLASQPLVAPTSAQPAAPYASPSQGNGQSAKFQPPVALDSKTIAQLGANEARQTAALTAQVLEKVTAPELGGDIATRLTEVVATAKSFDFKSLQSKNQNVFQRVMQWGKNQREAALTTFKSLNARIDDAATAMAGQLAQRQQLISHIDGQITQLKASHESLTQLLEQLTKNYEAMHRWYSQLDNSQFQGLEAFNYAEYGKTLLELHRKMAELDAYRNSLIQNMAILTSQKDTAKALVEKTNAALTIGVSAWKQQFAIAWANASNASNAAAIQNVSNWVNEMTLSNATTAKETALAATALANTTIISADTIEKAATLIADTFAQVADANRAGFAQREQDADRMRKANDEMIAKIRAAQQVPLISK